MSLYSPHDAAFCSTQRRAVAILCPRFTVPLKYAVSALHLSKFVYAASFVIREISYHTTMTFLKKFHDGPIATLTIDREQSMNPLGNPGDGDEFEKICRDLNRDMSVRCVILTGAGRAFSAGGDVKAMRERTGTFGGTPPAISDGYRENIHVMLRALYGLRVPLIAAVNGPAIGLGCDVACLADIRIASDRAKFGVTFLKLGIIPGDGGTWILPRVIGQARAAELFYTGDVIDAATALDWGMVSRVIKPEALLDEARALAERIAGQPPHALRQAKMLLRQGQQVSYDSALELAANTQAMMHPTRDHEEGVAALLEKRSADFTGE